MTKPLNNLVAIILLGLVPLLTHGQRKWYAGANVTPHKSYVFNLNDQKAEFETGKVVNGDINYLVSRDNGSGAVPDGLSGGLIGGYIMSDWFTAEAQLIYSFQRQRYFVPSEDDTTRIRFADFMHFVKVPIQLITNIRASNAMTIELIVGVQPSYLIKYSETYTSILKGDPTRYSRFEKEALELMDEEGNTFIYQADGPLFNRFNVEGILGFGFKWALNDDFDFFTRFIATHSIFDIENKDVQITLSDGSKVNYYDSVHSPYKQATGDNDCHSCSDERPSTYNFTFGLSAGVMYYF